MRQRRSGHRRIIVTADDFGCSSAINAAVIRATVRAELYFHPTTSLQPEPVGPNLGDLETLLSPAVRHAIGEEHLHLTGYANLLHQEGGCTHDPSKETSE